MSSSSAPVLVHVHIREAVLDFAHVSQVDVGDSDQLDMRAGGQRVDVGGRLCSRPQSWRGKGFRLERRSRGARIKAGKANTVVPPCLRTDRRVTRGSFNDIGRFLATEERRSGLVEIRAHGWRNDLAVST